MESFKNYVLQLCGVNNITIITQRDNVKYDGLIFDDFIKEAIPNSDYPSPIALIISKRYIIVPASPD